MCPVCESLVAAELLLSHMPLLPHVLGCVAEMARNCSIALGTLEIAFEFLVVPSEKTPCSWAQRKGTIFQVSLKPLLWALFSADMSF